MIEKGLLESVNKHIAKKKYGLALKELEELIKKEPDSLEISEKLAYAYAVTDEYDKAIEFYNKVVGMDPARPDPYHQLGNMHKMKGRNEEAMSYFEKALEIDPLRGVSMEGLNTCRLRKRLNKVHVYIDDKDYEKALKEAEQIVREEPASLEALEKLAYVYGFTGQYDAAIELYGRVIKMDPRRPEPYHELGNIHKTGGRYDKAIAYFKKALKLDPGRSVSMTGIGLCMRQKGRIKKSIQYLRKAISIDPGETTACKSLIDIYIEKRMNREFVEFYDSLKRSDSSGIIDRDLGMKYILVKGFFYKDYERVNGGGDLRRALSDVYKKINSGKYDGKEEKAILGLLIDDLLSEAKELRGKKKDAGAISKYRDVLNLDPENTEARQAFYITEKYVHTSKRPHFCAVSISFGCMLRCKMCRIWENHSAVKELSLESWKSIIDDLSDFMDDNRTINFAGGEPLLRGDLIEIIRYSSRRGFKPAICTNAWLIDEEMAMRLVDSGLDIAAISLDSLDEKTHDFLRGVDGSYKRVMNAIGYLNKYNKDKKIRIHIQPIISQVNLDDLIDLTHWVNRHEGLGDITFLSVIQPPNTNSDYQAWYKKEEFALLWPRDKVKVDAVMDELVRLKLSDKITSYKIGNQVFQLQAYKEYFADPGNFYKKRIQCNIGIQFVNVHINGDIKLCHYSDVIIGNLTRQKIADIWDSNLSDSERKKIKLCQRKCHQILNCMKDESPYLKK